MLKEAKLVQIGNSQGIRLPKTMISKYKLEGVCVLEEIEEGILIHAPDQGKLSWEETYKEMSLTSQDEWAEWQELDIDLDRH